MTSDTITIKTPGGKEVAIRNYTTHGDDKLVQNILNRGMTAQAGKDGDPVITFDASAIAESEAKYVELLVQSIDGNSDHIAAQLDGLRSDDYAAIAAEVRRISNPDPKASSKT